MKLEKEIEKANEALRRKKKLLEETNEKIEVLEARLYELNRKRILQLVETKGLSYEVLLGLIDNVPLSDPNANNKEHVPKSKANQGEESDHPESGEERENTDEEKKE